MAEKEQTTVLLDVELSNEIDKSIEKIVKIKKHLQENQNNKDLQKEITKEINTMIDNLCCLTLQEMTKSLSFTKRTMEYSTIKNHTSTTFFAFPLFFIFIGNVFFIG